MIYRRVIELFKLALILGDDTIISQHRQDGKDYTGILTLTVSEPVEVLLGHRLNIDNNTPSKMDMKRLGDLFLVNLIHPNFGYVL